MSIEILASFTIRVTCTMCKARETLTAFILDGQTPGWEDTEKVLADAAWSALARPGEAETEVYCPGCTQKRKLRHARKGGCTLWTVEVHGTVREQPGSAQGWDQHASNFLRGYYQATSCFTSPLRAQDGDCLRGWKVYLWVRSGESPKAAAEHLFGVVYRDLFRLMLKNVVAYESHPVCGTEEAGVMQPVGNWE